MRNRSQATKSGNYLTDLDLNAKFKSLSCYEKLLDNKLKAYLAMKNCWLII